MDRRTALVAGVAALGLSACTTGGVNIAELEKQIVDIITKVQQGVKDACSLVPTANSVLAVLSAIAGSNAQVAAFLAGVDEAIRFISQVCPVAPVPGVPKAAPANVRIKEQSVPVVFY